MHSGFKCDTYFSEVIYYNILKISKIVEQLQKKRYTSVISRFGRNFSRPMVYCFFKVGNAPVSSYSHSEPALCRAAFICSTASNQSPSVTLVVSMVVLPPSL